VSFERTRANSEFFSAESGRLASLCDEMAQRFLRGGRILAVGEESDARHVAVEFVHPVIVGKRALPALSLTADVATVTGVANRVGLEDVFAHQLRIIGEPADIALGISTDGECANVRRALETARDLGMLTVALTSGDGGAIARTPGLDHVLVARSSDPRVVKEVHVTTYHVLWELVHVFFEHPGVLTPEVAS
jgi:D-sedoheptulose 7-phosphate isomerase